VTDKPKVKKLPPQPTVPRRYTKYQPNQERVYFRNDGNKHIKSKGTLC
jgi:hypothetical protein